MRGYRVVRAVFEVDFFFFCVEFHLRIDFSFFYFFGSKPMVRIRSERCLRMRGDFCVYKNGKWVWVGYKDFLKKVNKNVGGNKSWKKIGWLALNVSKY